MKWIPALAAFLAIPAGAGTWRLPLDGIKQKQSDLCWAAVSAMASRAFPVDCQFKKPTQAEVIFSAHTTVRTHDLPRRCPARNSCPASAALCPPVVAADPLQPAIDVCGADAGNEICNDTGQVWLLDVRSRKVGQFGLNNSRELTAARIKKEIKDREAPVLISWFFVDPDDLDEAEQLERREAGQGVETLNRNRLGGHFLIITGYKDTNGKKKVRVWDPWPEESADEPEGHIRHKWIPYERYQDPVIDNGSPVNADHDADEFALCRCAEAEVESVESLQAPDAQAIQSRTPLQISAPGTVDFSHSVPELLEERKDFLRTNGVLNAAGRKVGGTLHTETGFATVAIPSGKLLRNRERPEMLIQSKTAALVVPVMRDKKLVDSFLLVRSGDAWVEGGYSNNEIARRLTQFRAERSSEGNLYLLALPEEGKFYVARGFGPAAEVVPLDGNTRHTFEPASRVLGKVATEIERKRHTDRPVPR